MIIDVKEPKELVQSKLQDRFNFTFPLLLDLDGTVAASFAPPDVLQDLVRDEVMLASNLLIDPEGNIQFMSLLDSRNFNTKLVDLKKRLDGFHIQADQVLEDHLIPRDLPFVINIEITHSNH